MGRVTQWEHLTEERRRAKLRQLSDGFIEVAASASYGTYYGLVVSDDRLKIEVTFSIRKAKQQNSSASRPKKGQVPPSALSLNNHSS